MKIFKVDYNPLWAIRLIVAANSMQEAAEMAKKTVTQTDQFEVEEIDISEPGVISYESDNY